VALLLARETLSSRGVAADKAETIRAKLKDLFKLHCKR